MRNYELSVIADPELDTQSLNSLEERIQKRIEATGGKVLKIDRWGKRRLAYAIHKHNDGYYYFYQIEMPSQAGEEIERDLRLNEQVLRYMISLQESA